MGPYLTYAGDGDSTDSLPTESQIQNQIAKLQVKNVVYGQFLSKIFDYLNNRNSPLEIRDRQILSGFIQAFSAEPDDFLAFVQAQIQVITKAKPKEGIVLVALLFKVWKARIDNLSLAKLSTDKRIQMLSIPDQVRKKFPTQITLSTGLSGPIFSE